MESVGLTNRTVRSLMRLMESRGLTICRSSVAISLCMVFHMISCAYFSISLRSDFPSFISHCIKS